MPSAPGGRARVELPDECRHDGAGFVADGRLERVRPEYFLRALVRERRAPGEHLLGDAGERGEGRPVVRRRVARRLLRPFATPKSATSACPPLRRMFSGLTSRWTTPCS